MSNTTNLFGLLSGQHDGGNELASASNNAAKNRRKKERRNQKRAGGSEAGDPAPPGVGGAAEPVQPSRPHNKWDLDQASANVISEASSSDCWQVWDSWLREVRKPMGK